MKITKNFQNAGKLIIRIVIHPCEKDPSEGIEPSEGRIRTNKGYLKIVHNIHINREAGNFVKDFHTEKNISFWI